MLFTNDKEFLVVSDAVHRLVERAITLDGTCEYCHYPQLHMVISLLGLQVLESTVSVLARRSTCQVNWEKEL